MSPVSVRTDGATSSRNGLVRKIVSIPRSIIGGFSRVMGTSGGRRNYQNPQIVPPTVNPQEWEFLSVFQHQYGCVHPFFYACSFMEAVKIAEEEHKFLFVYIHLPEHPFSASFCRESLGAEVVVQFLNANFICWGGLAYRGEGLLMATTVKATSFPFWAVIAPSPAAGDSITVLQQMEGPISAAELVEMLQRTIEEKGLAFDGTISSKPNNKLLDQEKIRADRLLREEQDAAYFASLHLDMEKEKVKGLAAKNQGDERQKEVSTTANNQKLKHSAAIQKQHAKVKDASFTTQQTPYMNLGKVSQATRILIRFPNGEKREQSFSSNDKIKSVYRYIDSLGLQGIENYRLISSFPRKVYGIDEMGMSLKDAGLHPRATLFLEHLH